MDNQEKRLFHWIFVFIGVVVLLGMWIPVMEIDAAQYASISKQMWQDKSFLQIIHRNLNYLDKPPLLFWLSGLSMGILGFNDFAFKLPSVLSSLIGVWSVFKFAQYYYRERVAYHAAVMYATSVAFFIFNNDIRTDTLIINFLIFTVYQLVVFRDTGSWRAFTLAFAGIGLSMLSKGPLGIVFPAMALGMDVLLKRQFKFIFNWRWLLGFVIIALILSPMLWGLYQQFDSRPEAWVNGEQGVSGLKFYFWTQSFGRITGDSVWATAYSNNPGSFFLFNTFLWAFLPWTPLFLVGFIRKSFLLFKWREWTSNQVEWINYFAFLLPLLALSKSGYQLNHYIYVVIPFAAILAAKEWVNLVEQPKLSRILSGYSLFFLLVVMVIAVLIAQKVFPLEWFYWVGFILLSGAIWFLFLKRSLFLSIAASVSLAFLMMNGYFYPQLLSYQGGKELSAKMDELRTEESEFYFFKTGIKHSVDFYQEKWVPHLGYILPDDLPRGNPVFLVVDQEGEKELNEMNIRFDRIDSIGLFPVTQMNANFLNMDTRINQLHWRYIVKLNPHITK